MSGTSMDGVDLALCEIEDSDAGRPVARIIEARTYPYDEKWRVRLSQLKYQPAENYPRTDIFYGRYLGELVNTFLQETASTAHLVASHGHTIFHDPEGWHTSQVGDGATLSATCGLPVVSNFRRADVALGGQGAPLVTFGDALLFPDYPICLNLGGFCNISGSLAGKRMAYDISPCNIVLNRLARLVDKHYDEDGEIARSGSINFSLLERLNGIPYYKQTPPKSLGREWINKNFWHIVRDYDEIPMPDRMKTLVVHIAFQIARAIDQFSGNNGAGAKVLTTGGGALNTCLMEFLREETEAEILVPEKIMVEYKEALIFALMGLYRVRNRANIFPEATGATAASSAGSLDGDFSAFYK